MKIFGNPDKGTLEQLHDVAGGAEHVALMGDAHFGYFMPIGGVAAYDNKICPAGVGYDIACLDSETEFLSPRGWVKLSEYQGQQVCQYDPLTGEGSFTTPSAYIKRESLQPMFHLQTRSIDHLVSPDHKLILRNTVGNWVETTAQEFAHRHDATVQGVSWKFETALQLTTLGSIVWSDDEIRVQVMTCADGCLDKRWPSQSVRLCVKKERKITRARTLLEKAGIAFSERPQKDGFHNFRFISPMHSKSLDFIWGCSHAQLLTVIDEITRWDGQQKPLTFFTGSKESADSVQFAFVATGHRSVQRCDIRRGVPEYRVFAYKKSLTGMKTVPKYGVKNPIVQIDAPDGYEYCFTVPTGFFIVRRNGKVIVTGNCGNCAVQTELQLDDLTPQTLHEWGEAIFDEISFGLKQGMMNQADDAPTDAVVLKARAWDLIPKEDRDSLHDRARNQLGTIGSGNHYIDILCDENERIWVGVHFGSRGMGHTIAKNFMRIAAGGTWGEGKIKEQGFLLDLNETSGQDYQALMELAGFYAHTGRKWVVGKVMRIIGAKCMADYVHNHHNYAWHEEHFGEDLIVIRKGATPAWPGQRGFVGGSMGDNAVILRGTGSLNPEVGWDEDTRSLQEAAMFSTVHGAGRVMSRKKAKKIINQDEVDDWLERTGVQVFGAGLDEAPQAYRRLDDVLKVQGPTIEVVHTLRPLIVCMA